MWNNILVENWLKFNDSSRKIMFGLHIPIQLARFKILLLTSRKLYAFGISAPKKGDVDIHFTNLLLVEKRFLPFPQEVMWYTH